MPILNQIRERLKASFQSVLVRHSYTGLIIQGTEKPGRFAPWSPGPGNSWGPVVLTGRLPSNPVVLTSKPNESGLVIPVLGKTVDRALPRAIK
jgi:hypothetical protein